jgi:acid phosphatase family membrane protein YuiD
MTVGRALFQILQNPVVVTGFTAWFLAQSLKVILGFIEEKRFNFRWFVGSGGMPSSHAALVMSVAVAVGLSEGFGSPIFALALTFALVTMFDAQGVRRQSGHQAEALNKMLDDIYSQRGIQEAPLKELFGHTPVEVMAGAALGIVVAVALPL